MSFGARVCYSIVLVVAIGTAWWMTHRKQQQLNLSRSQRVLIGFFAFLGAGVGAKIPFLLEQGWNGVLQGSVWFADGKTILGGIVGGYLAVEIAKGIGGIRVRTGDSFAVPVAIAICVGRLGCFLAGCCYGQVTHMPWGVNFHIPTDPNPTLRHPTQLYEMAFHLLAAGVLMLCDRYRWIRGNQLKAYFIAYFAFRFVTEWLRPEAQVWLGLTLYQLASAVLIAVLLLLWYVQDKMVSDHSPFAGSVP
jgi:phosphatidylglycerol:prolipoprotein diacylglycerol transferase